MNSSMNKSFDEIEMPALFAAAEQASAESQSKFYLTTAAELFGLALAAAAAMVPKSMAMGAGPIIALVLFVAVLLLQVSKIGREAESRWYDARAAAESIKSAAWQFAVGGEAFRMGMRDPDTRFVEILKEILQSVPHLNVGAATSATAGVTSSMRELRDSPQETRAAVYRRLRIDNQVDWYSRKSLWNKRRARFYTYAVIALEGVAIIMGAIRIGQGADIDFIGVFAAFAAGIIGWIQTKKYAFLAESYAVTSHEVNLVSSSVSAPVAETSWAQSIHDAEAAFSREHTMWQARRQGPS